MNSNYWIRQLRSSPHLSDQLRAVRYLKEVRHQPGVHAALFLTAVDTPWQPLRAALLAALRGSAGAEAYFLGVAGGEGPVYLRKWALYNLGLMGSRRARAVVLAGLQDPCGEVRKAAACHVALYTDGEVRNAFIDYFEARRLIYLRDCLARLSLPLRRLYRELSAIRDKNNMTPLQPAEEVRG